MSLFDGIDPRRGPARVSVEGFRRFHAANPQIYRLFCRFAFQAMQAGRRRFSGRTIIHRIRWYTTVETDDPAGFKINDHWSPFYVRLFERDHPEHDGFFEKRRALADLARDPG